MENFAGMLEYLMSWVWVDENNIRSRGGCVFSIKALPFLIADDGTPIPVGEYAAEQLVFPRGALAFDYLMLVAKADLRYRGFRDERLRSFEYKQLANVLLHKRVLIADAHEYELLRQSWDTTNRPKYSSKVWSEEQEEAFRLLEKGVSYDDENVRSDVKTAR